MVRLWFLKSFFWIVRGLFSFKDEAKFRKKQATKSFNKHLRQPAESHFVEQVARLVRIFCGRNRFTPSWSGLCIQKSNQSTGNSIGVGEIPYKLPNYSDDGNSSLGQI